MWLLPDGRVINRKEFILDGKFHKSNIFDKPDTLDELNIKQFVEKGFNQIYYKSVSHVDSELNGVVTRVHKIEPKMSIDDLKGMLIKKVKEQAKSLLNNTDWYVIRSVESIDVPKNISDFRSNVRALSNTIEDEINALNDYDSLVEFNWNTEVIDEVQSNRWPSDPTIGD